MEKKKCESKTSIGGQAVLEGVMMRGKTAQATAVRIESGEIVIEAKRTKPLSKANKIPFLRGVIAFFDSLVGGTKTLMRSASVQGEDETSAFEDWLAKKLGVNATDFAVFLGAVLGILLSFGLFYFLPQVIADLFTFVEPHGIWYSLIEGLVRILIFVCYVLLTTLLKDIRRTYMYHGAEHKTINCYEKGLELTVDNVKSCSRVHDRCGTTFTFLVMTISILTFALVNGLLHYLGVNFVGAGGKALRFLIKILTLPLITGISYEILKLLAKTKNPVFNVFKAPGLLLQRLTTREPSGDMIEVAITAFNKVLQMDEDQSVEEISFSVSGTVSTLYKKVKTILQKAKINDDSDVEWIVARVTGLKRSEILSSKETVTAEMVEQAIKYANERAKGIPLYYVFGDAEFYGYTFKVDSNVLIPRPETEELVFNALKEISEDSSVLDMCTGSGVIAITVNLKTGAKTVAVDISDDALNVAKENAKNLLANVEFINSNMFEKVSGKFNVIISNPPYIMSNDIKSLQKEVKCEPASALDGGADGLDFYRILQENSYKFLLPNGYLFMECGINQATDIKSLFLGDNNYKDIEIIKDISGIDRIVKVRRNDA